MKKITATLVTLSTLLTIGCGGSSSSDDTLTFEVIDCPAIATHTLITEPNMELINNPHRFVELYLASDLDAQQNEPNIDFEKRSVLSIHLGEKTTSGHEVTITGVEDRDSRILVNYEVVSPSEGCAVDTGLTYPYCFVSIEKTDKTVEYRASNIRKCSN